MKVTRSVDGPETTMGRLVSAIEHRGLTIMTRFDHAALAAGVDLELPAVKVLVFGNPRAGTPLMARDPRVGIELPLRVLVWDDGNPGAMLGYHDPRSLATEYDLDGFEKTLDAMAQLLADVTTEAANVKET